MIVKNLGIVKLFITDTEFGDVVPGDPTFLDRFENQFSWRPHKVVWMNQTHSNNVRFLNDVDEEVMILEDSDGVMTNKKNILLVTKTADCVPILFWNKNKHVVAAVHCGWKGFLKGILESFAELCQERGLDMSDFSAFLGPHLRAEHFEVRQDFVDQIPQDKRGYLITLDGKQVYDLTKGVICTLEQLGIKELQDCGMNTYNNSAYFSYRGWCHLPESQRPEKYSTFANCIVLSESHD